MSTPSTGSGNGFVGEERCGLGRASQDAWEAARGRKRGREEEEEAAMHMRISRRADLHDYDLLLEREEDSTQSGTSSFCSVTGTIVSPRMCLPPWCRSTRVLEKYPERFTCITAI